MAGSRRPAGATLVVPFARAQPPFRGPGAGRGAYSLLRYFPASGGANPDAASAAGAFSLSGAHALPASGVRLLCPAVRWIARPLLPQAARTALVARVRVAERRNVLCPAPVISRHRPSRTAGQVLGQ